MPSCKSVSPRLGQTDAEQLLGVDGVVWGEEKKEEEEEEVGQAANKKAANVN